MERYCKCQNEMIKLSTGGWVKYTVARQIEEERDRMDRDNFKLRAENADLKRRRDSGAKIYNDLLRDSQELAARIDKALSILSMGNTTREREAWQALTGKEAKS